MRDDGVEQGPQVAARDPRVDRCHAGTGVRIQDRELNLILRSVEVDEQVVYLVEHFLRTRVRPVDLVQNHDGRQTAFERLAEHESRLRKRAFRCIDQQHHAVDHRQRALHLSTEVGVPGSVHDIDEVIAIPNGCVLGQDGDAALTFEVGVVHDALCDLLIGAERATLPQKRVNERGLAVIDVSDDGNVAPQRICDMAGFAVNRHNQQYRRH